MLFRESARASDAVLRAMKHVATHTMGVPALDPADAADGEYPDWYEPTA